MRVITTGRSHRVSQGNRERGLHSVLDGVGNPQGNGDVVVIRVNPPTLV